jgi:hypothetical protein
VSNSLLGEFVASTGTSLKNVRQAAERAASAATSSLLDAAPGNETLGGADRSSSARRLPSPIRTKGMSGSRRAASIASDRSLASPIVPK